VGDLHFSQGDGEISFCGAIEMAGVITINFKLLKNGIADLGLKSPIYLPGSVEAHFSPSRYIYVSILIAKSIRKWNRMLRQDMYSSRGFQSMSMASNTML
jgi:acetamidase/formamidase